MYDPAIDPPAGPFSYLAKPSNLLAIVGQRGATQVTWEGAFYTGAAELCIVAGDPPQPVAVRVKQLGLGRLPIVHYAWQGGDVRYSVSGFAAMVQVGGELVPVNFLRLGMRRMAQARKEGPPAPALIGCGVRGSGGDHRATALGVGLSDPSARHEFAEDSLAVGGAAVCLLPEAAPAKRYAVPAENPSIPFSARATLIVLWDLGAAEERQIDLKMPWRPIPLSNTDALKTIRAAAFDAFADQLAEEWNAKLAEGADLSFPEDKPPNAYAASLAYLLMSVERLPGGPARLVHRLRKEPLSPGESTEIIHALEVAGQLPLARECLMGMLDRQESDGCLSPEGDVRGQAEVITAAGRHYALTGDRDWASGIYPKLQRAVAWLTEALLMQSATRRGKPAAPAEQLTVASALAEASDLAAALGHQEDADRWRAQLAATSLPASAEFPALPADAVGPLLRTAESALLVSRLPGGGLEDAQITALCERLHRSYAEGIPAEEGILSPLAGIEVARLHLVRGEQEQALRDLYGILVHTGSGHEGFASGARAWGDRDSGGDFTPDPVFAAGYVQLVRDLLIREQGDALHLFSALAPGWVQPDKPVGFKNALTTFGTVSAVATLSEKGAQVEIAAQWKQRPARIVLHVPWFAQVTQVTADQPGAVRREGQASVGYETPDLPTAVAGEPNRWIELTPDTTRVTIVWQLRKTEPLSYEEVLEAWRGWYAKVYDRHLADGGRRLRLEPLPLQ